MCVTALPASHRRTMRRSVEITFMSLDDVIGAPDLTEHAQRYFGGDAQHDAYQNSICSTPKCCCSDGAHTNISPRRTPKWGRVTWERRRNSSSGLNSIPKLVASSTLQDASWNATIIAGDVGKRIREQKAQPGRNIVKYGNGVLDRALFGEDLIDEFCVIIYPFLLGHGTRLFEKVGRPTHLTRTAEHRFDSGTVVVEYTRGNTK